MSMKLSDVFDQLTFGELSNLSLGGLEAGGVDPANYKQVLLHVNLGLIALYRRFYLKENRLTLTLQPGQTLYPLMDKYAVNSKRSAEAVRFIADTPALPFSNDVLKIEKVFTDQKFELSLNQEVDLYSCFTPTLDSLRVADDIITPPNNLPDQYKTATLTVVYRASHAPIVIKQGLFDPTRVPLELPYSHLQALLLFVASRVNNPIGATTQFNSGDNYATKYEQECQRLLGQNLTVDQGSGNSGIRRGGWV